MTVRTTRRLLHVLSAVSIAGAVALVVWGLIPPRPPVVRPPRLAGLKAVDAAVRTDGVTREQLASVWSKSLQADLKPPKAPEVVRTQPKPPPPPRPVNPRVELLATVLDTDKPVAFLTDARGQTDFKGVGETLNLLPAGLTVESIQADQVTLKLRGRAIRVQLKRASGVEDLLEPADLRGP